MDLPFSITAPKGFGRDALTVCYVTQLETTSFRSQCDISLLHATLWPCACFPPPAIPSSLHATPTAPITLQQTQTQESQKPAVILSLILLHFMHKICTVRGDDLQLPVMEVHDEFISSNDIPLMEMNPS